MIVLPWSCVMHDNHRLKPFVLPLKGKPGKYTARLVPSDEYKQAKASAEQRIQLQWRRPPLTGHVQLIAHVFVPDLRKRDAGNYRKLITDALTGVAYDDDAQIADERWIKALDRTNPRVEIVLCTYTPTLFEHDAVRPEKKDRGEGSP